MEQHINNQGPVERQLNIKENSGPIFLTKKTRFARRFEKLNQEVKNDERYEGTMEALKFYLTKLDGISAETKLYDGGFNENEVTSAIRRKENYAKRLQLNRFFESAQWIDSQLFAKIKMDFEAFITPLIDIGSSKSDILKEVVVKVVQPVLDLINLEGEDDEILNYNAEDIFGMVYFLTGQCHINWKNYDNI